MGSWPSKKDRHSSVSSSDPSSEDSRSSVGSSEQVEPLSPVSVVTSPAPRRRLATMSALIDPADLLSDSDWSIQSPSGNLLSPQAYIDHPDRPLSMRERQERVLAGMKKVREEREIREARESAEALMSQSAKVKGLARLLCY